MNLIRSVLLALLLPFTAFGGDAPPLPALGVDGQSVTVSGISSGGYMAVQFHVAHSATVSGAAILAAGPWDCAHGTLWRAFHACMSPGNWGGPPPTGEETEKRALAAARAGQIDSLEGLQADRVWLLSGGNDHTVDRKVVDSLAAFYRRRVAADALSYVTPPDLGHAMPSLDDPQANPCPTSDPPFINHCERLDAAGDLLTHLLGPLAPKAPQPTGELRSFDQQSFTAAAGAHGMGAMGYAYVPTTCRKGGCRLHVAFHGCRQSADQIGDRYARLAGYNRWADTNRLVILYPQTTPRSGWSTQWPPTWTYNPLGCWDWWGYESVDYVSRSAPQIRAVQTMIDRLAAPVGQ